MATLVLICQTCNARMVRTHLADLGLLYYACAGCGCMAKVEPGEEAVLVTPDGDAPVKVVAAPPADTPFAADVRFVGEG